MHWVYSYVREREREICLYNYYIIVHFTAGTIIIYYNNMYYNYVYIATIIIIMLTATGKTSVQTHSLDLEHPAQLLLYL